jgi:hypothetical protein
MRKPRVFVGSAEEGLLLVGILKRELAPLADVVGWNDEGVFRANRTFLDELIRHTRECDLGLFLYEKDDRVISRGVESLRPRDNVIFEHGLFMSRLGLQRAFAIAPRKGVKVLSDLSGFKLLEYAESTRISKLRDRLRHARTDATKKAINDHLDAALTEVLRAGVLKELKDNLAPLPDERLFVTAGPPDVLDASASLARLMLESQKLAKPVVIEHLGLDLEVAWRLIRNDVLAKAAIRDVHWRCVMTDPNSELLRKATSESVSLEIAAERIKDIRKWCLANATALAARNVRFECRAYGSLPVMHGFLIKGAGLLLSVCDIRDGRLQADRLPYWEFADAPANTHMITCFSNWFEHLWTTGTSVYPENA